jgi:hypothetical protein
MQWLLIERPAELSQSAVILSGHSQVSKNLSTQNNPMIENETR